MKQHAVRITTAASWAVAMVAILAVFFARTDDGGLPRPSEAVANQAVVTAPPLVASHDAVLRSTVMGGPRASDHASR